MIRKTATGQQAMHNFLNSVENEINSQPFDSNLATDPNLNYNLLHNLLYKAKETCFPVKLVKPNKHKHKLSPWITTEIMHSIKFRDRIYQQLKSLDPNSPQHEQQEINLRTYNTILQRNIRQAKRIYYEEQFQKFSKDIKKTWEKINEIKTGSRKSELPSYFIVNDEKITDGVAIAEGYNQILLQALDQLFLIRLAVVVSQITNTSLQRKLPIILISNLWTISKSSNSLINLLPNQVLVMIISPPYFSSMCFL